MRNRGSGIAKASRSVAYRPLALGIAVLCLPLGAAGIAEEEPMTGGGTAEAVAEAPGPALSRDIPDPEGRVARSAFTTAVVDREPRDALEQLGNDVRSVSYFTELRGLDGETVTHRWELDGEVMSEVSFEVGSPRWRVYSTKRLDPARLGVWSVSVLDSQGRLLSQQSLRYVAAGSPPASGAEDE